MHEGKEISKVSSYKVIISLGNKSGKQVHALQPIKSYFVSELW
jgi:hypothetical protein